ncbi:hypothetical protein [Thermocatellispora tengchongensis]|uniref:hypothetical protein n=1 Tax=Thermocatellispora tengchongensis TaxID=1073253 RepID=UPI003631956D
MTTLTRKLGGTELEVGAIGLGCWAIGGPFLLDGKQDGWGRWTTTSPSARSTAPSIWA